MKEFYFSNQKAELIQIIPKTKPIPDNKLCNHNVALYAFNIFKPN